MELIIFFQGCTSPQIEDPNNPGSCCDAHALGNGTQCSCVSPQINDPDNNGECCVPDSTFPTKCSQGSPDYLTWLKMLFQLEVTIKG